MKTKILILIVSIAVLAGCTRKNYLDFEPVGNIIPTTIEDFRLILDQIERNLLTNEQGEIEGIEGEGFALSHFESLYVADNMEFTQGIAVALGFPNNAIAAYTFQERLYLASEEDPIWRNYYNQIYTANVVLTGLDDVTNGTEQEKNQLRAEAKLHRAFAYFNLVNLYGVHYDPSSAETDLGVPIREGIELVGIDLTRASVQQVYDYIIDDIMSSMNDLLPTSDMSVRFRPSEAGALGLLAKVYLYQGNYDRALEQIDMALAIYNTVRDMNGDILTEPVFGAIDLPLANADDEVVWFKSAIRQNTPASIVNNNLILELYEENDLRSLSYESLERLITNQDVEGRADYSFYGRTYNRTIPAGINVPDLLLIKAECEARLSNIVAANNALNELREKRFETGTYIPINITNPSDLLVFVKEERRRELMGQPQRMFDLKRYNRFDNANISLIRVYNGITYTLAPNSLNWAFPIAQKYILLNPEIAQNPRD